MQLNSLSFPVCNVLFIRSALYSSTPEGRGEVSNMTVSCVCDSVQKVCTKEFIRIEVAAGVHSSLHANKQLQLVLLYFILLRNVSAGFTGTRIKVQLRNTVHATRTGYHLVWINGSAWPE